MIDKSVRLSQSRSRAFVLLGCAVLLVFTPALTMHARADDRFGVARQQRTEARGWLQLERDQAVERERIGHLSPSATRELEIRERMERNDQRGLNRLQRQDLQSQARKDRLSRGAGGSRPASRALDLRHQRQLEQQRLQMRTNREIRR